MVVCLYWRKTGSSRPVRLSIIFCGDAWSVQSVYQSFGRNEIGSYSIRTRRSQRIFLDFEWGNPSTGWSMEYPQCQRTLQLLHLNYVESAPRRSRKLREKPNTNLGKSLASQTHGKICRVRQHLNHLLHGVDTTMVQKEEQTVLKYDYTKMTPTPYPIAKQMQADQGGKLVSESGNDTRFHMRPLIAVVCVLNTRMKEPIHEQ